MKNPDEAETVIKKLFKKMLDYKHQPYFIAYYLFTIQRLIYHKSSTLTKNQNVIVSRLISSEMRSIFSKISAGNYASSFLKYQHDKFLKFNYKGLSIQAVPPNMCLHLAFMDLVSNCSFDKNAYAENISSSLITKRDIQ